MSQDVTDNDRGKSLLEDFIHSVRNPLAFASQPPWSFRSDELDALTPELAEALRRNERDRELLTQHCRAVQQTLRGG
jgi:hypothetical protein